MKTLFLILAMLTSISGHAQHYTSPEMLPPTAGGGNSAVVVVHNHSALLLVCSFQGGAHYAYVLPHAVKEIAVPNGWSAFVTEPSSGDGTGMRDDVGADCDNEKPFIRHIHVFDDPSSGSTGVVWFKLPGVNLSNPWEEFGRGIALGLSIAVGVGVLRKIKAAFRVSSE